MNVTHLPDTAGPGPLPLTAVVPASILEAAAVTLTGWSPRLGTGPARDVLAMISAAGRHVCEDDAAALEGWAVVVHGLLSLSHHGGAGHHDLIRAADRIASGLRAESGRLQADRRPRPEAMPADGSRGGVDIAAAAATELETLASEFGNDIMQAPDTSIERLEGIGICDLFRWFAGELRDLDGAAQLALSTPERPEGGETFVLWDRAPAQEGDGP